MVEKEVRKEKKNEKPTTIEEFIKKMRKQNEDSSTDEDVTSTQNMIADARARKGGNTVNKCDQCDFNTASKAMLRLHKRTIHRGREIVAKAPIANKDSIEEESEQSKLKTANKAPYITKRIKCDQCEKKFNKESRFRLHMKTVHKGIECDHCEKILITKTEMSEHKRSVHESLALEVVLNREPIMNNPIELIK